MEHNQEVKRALDSFDITRCLCALLIIVIHTSPLATYSEIANFYLCNVIARVAVPLFFAMSGFLFSCKANLKRQMLRIVKIYLGWSVIYLLIQIPQWYKTGWWGLYVVKDYIVALIAQGSYYHLWYLLATLYALPVLYILIKKLPKPVLIGASTILWILECLTYSYGWIGIENSFPWLIGLFNRFSAITSAILRALPLMITGMIAGKQYTDKSAKAWGKRALFAFGLAAAEASLLYFFSPNKENVSYLFMTPVATYYAICFLLNWNVTLRNKRTATILRNCSLIIYCVHPLVYHFVQKAQCPAGILRWILVTILSVAIALLIDWIRAIYVRRKVR